MNQPLGQMKLGHYLQQWWRQLSPAGRRRRLGIVGVLSLVWLAGAAHAPSAVDGITRLEGPTRILISLSMGALSFLWRGLKAFELIAETQREPHLLWIPLALTLPAACYGFILLLERPASTFYILRKRMEELDRSQGRTPAADVAEALAVEAGVPLAEVRDKKGKLVRVGVSFAGGEGHALVIGPTRSGKGLHLTETLLSWPGPALVVDPKGEQLARTAGSRRSLGPIYSLPGHRLPLAYYYKNLLDRDAVSELHNHLLRPWASRETIFAEKSRALFHAAARFARARGLDPLRVLLDLAESDPVQALGALETVPEARSYVRVFTNGAAPREFRDDRFVTSALGNFTTRLDPYQRHVDTIAPPAGFGDPLAIDPRWPELGGTVYITYPLQDLQGVGGVVAAIIAAILRRQLARQARIDLPRRRRLLVAIDELPAVGLRNVSDYLATAGGYGVTLLLYAQSMAQLEEIYGAVGARAIRTNCAHEVWYPPADEETAEVMSRLYGQTLQAMPSQNQAEGARQMAGAGGQARTQTSRNQGVSWSWQERPALTGAQMRALNNDQVLVATRNTRPPDKKRKGKKVAQQELVFLARRLNPLGRLSGLPSATGLRLPRPRYGARRLTDWQAQGARQDDEADDEPAVEQESGAHLDPGDAL